MSEWIRHRGSKSMPKRLEGKYYEAMRRDGTIAAFVNSWLHYGRDSDVLKYRITGKITPPDHSKGFPVGTTAKDIGAKVGDEFVVVKSKLFQAGEVVTLLHDDDSECPKFTNGHQGRYVYFEELAPIPPKTAIELQAEEVGITEPVQLVDDAKPDADGWIEWKGGDCPVPDGTLVDLKYRNGEEEYELSTKDIDWLHDQHPYDAVAYRLHQPQEWPEDRMDVIGQNGNDGLHYGAAPTNKYQRTIKGVAVDVYDVLAAFGVTCQARGHAIKKLLMAGQRGHKDEVQDLLEAVQAIERSIELAGK